MMRLEVISRGHAVPARTFDAVVHSVFHGAANLQLRRGGRLLTLVTSGAADLPQGIRLATPAGFSFEENLDAGGRMTCSEGILRDERGRLMVDLRAAKRWKCRLPFVDMAAPPVAAAWASVREALEARWRFMDRGGFPAARREIGAHLGALIEAFRRHDPTIGESAVGLIGLGPGLTPAGDDILVGFLAGLHCAPGSDDGECRAFLPALAKVVVRFSQRTNDISRTYLFHAARGQVSSALADLAEAIARGDHTDRLWCTAQTAMQNGHSSGMETVFGFLVGLSLQQAQGYSNVWESGFVAEYTREQ